MNKWFLAGLLLIAANAPAAAAVLGIEVFDNATLIASQAGIVGGTADLVTNDASFANISVSVQGSPVLPHGDLSTVTLDASTAAGFVGSHVLTVDVFQTAISAFGPTRSTFTINGLIGDPGPITESTFIDGSATALGTPLASHTFVVGDLDDHAGPITVGAGAFAADASAYGVTFTSAGQSFGGSTELTTNVPEPSTWAMLALGFFGLGLSAWAHKRSPIHAL